MPLCWWAQAFHFCWHLFWSYRLCSLHLGWDTSPARAATMEVKHQMCDETRDLSPDSYNSKGSLLSWAFIRRARLYGWTFYKHGLAHLHHRPSQSFLLTRLPQEYPTTIGALAILRRPQSVKPEPWRQCPSYSMPHWPFSQDSTINNTHWRKIGNTIRDSCRVSKFVIAPTTVCNLK